MCPENPAFHPWLPSPAPRRWGSLKRLPLPTRAGGLAALAAFALTACAVGPDYERPQAPSGVQAAGFKESAGWKVAAPAQVDASQAWWQAYGDETLNRLVAQANEANQTLAQAAAQYRQATALVGAAAAAGQPTLGVSSTTSRVRSNTGGALYEGYTHSALLQSAWEPDVWGKVGRSTEAARANAEASGADLAAARLSVQALVVNDYLQLRLADAALATYQATLQAYEKALQLTQSQHRSGVATQADVALAESTLQAARAQATDVQLSRRQLEHALAVLLGKTPAEFSIPASPEAQCALPGLPGIPAVLPSALLERRPDIAGAERRVAAANANIGVAAAAWYPALNLTGSAGSSGSGVGNWLAAPYRIWAVGAQVAATLYDGGLRSAQDKQARAAFDAAAAAYRQTVLAGFQEVEDNLAALDQLARERVQQEAALAAARTAERIVTRQYEAGTAPYASVITAQALALNSERAALQLQGRQLTASVTLIKALGGGWTAHHD
ncbi:efflux transporter outer membrane subunit [Curvibacter gracilis]|uniref:efflux transporter outer membrane subunit n=1 Tax=Curvibacter gracilis TaxID=230310 RepID=UPI0004B8247A|nr:efflux transporter outer membrane subunit [Curvibacter gracilis]